MNRSRKTKSKLTKILNEMLRNNYEELFETKGKPEGSLEEDIREMVRVLYSNIEDYRSTTLKILTHISINLEGILQGPIKNNSLTCIIEELISLSGDPSLIDDCNFEALSDQIYFLKESRDFIIMNPDRVSNYEIKEDIISRFEDIIDFVISFKEEEEIIQSFINNLTYILIDCIKSNALTVSDRSKRKVLDWIIKELILKTISNQIPLSLFNNSYLNIPNKVNKINYFTGSVR